MKSQERASIRNLVQYKNLSDAEFDELMDRKEMNAEPVKIFEDRIKRKLAEFEKDYDLTDMKFNDLQSLRALAQALITLEDLEVYSYKLRMEGITLDNLTLMDKISKQLSDLRNDISKLQDDLKISRKVRKGDKEESVVLYIEKLKQKAAEFYESKMNYILCPKCNMLLGTVWTLYPEAKNKITLTCQRELDSGEKCGTIVTVTTKEMLERKNTNTPEVLPENFL